MAYYDFGNIKWLKLVAQNTETFQLTVYENSLTEIFVEENSRLSPTSFLNNSIPNVENGKWDILFLYNANLSRVLETVDRCPNEKYFICVTWGLANVVIFKETSNDYPSFSEFKNLSENWELWSLNQGIGEVSHIEMSEKKIDNLSNLSMPSPTLDTLEFKCVFDEYVLTINSIVKNCRKYLVELEPYFNQLHSFVSKNLISNGSLDEIEIIDCFVALNASLSRVNTQLFSCCNGIVANKCPIQNHSLFGVGIASLALFKYSMFLEKNILENNVTGLLDSIAEIIISPSKKTDWHERIYENQKQVNALKNIKRENDTGVPIIPFFSGRDGFRYGKITNISTPMMCLYNAHRCSWNLLTFTHELSHLFVEGTVTLLENYSNNDFRTKITKNRIKFPLEEPVQYIDWAWSLYNATKLALVDKKDKDFCVETELNELITHIVDFLYFYNGDIEKYMKFIWYSWLKVPSVEKRIRKYIVRTGVTILSVALEQKREEYIKSTLIEGFTRLHKETKEPIFTTITNDYLKNDDEWTKIFELITEAVHIIELVRVLLFDETISANVEKEPRRVDVAKNPQKNLSSNSDPYGFKLGAWQNSDMNISNPIFFIKNYSINDKGNEQYALWFFNKLASLEVIK